MEGTNRMIPALKIAAAAAALALGSSLATAQQSQQGQTPQRSTQPTEQPSAAAERQNTRPTEQGGRAASSQSAKSTLDPLVEEHRDLGMFVEALETAGLVDSLTEGKQYTLFAPTDQAFEASDKDLQQLMRPENREDLVALLRAHIVADDVDPQMAERLEAAQTIDGSTVELASQGGKLMIGDANVVQSNIEHGNLRIYAIDEVLDAELRTALADDDDRRL